MAKKAVIKSGDRPKPTLTQRSVAKTMKENVRRVYPFEEPIRSRWSRIKAIDAVYLDVEVGTEVVHVYSLVPEFRSDLYRRLESPEKRLEGEFPEFQFEFHVRAHQGRNRSFAVPFDAQLLFSR